VTRDYFDAIANYARSLITHIGLVGPSGAELSGLNYRRQPVTWTAVKDGQIAPTTDLRFAIPPRTTVAGWHGFSAATGGTDYGGEAVTPETFNGGGDYTLLAAGTGIVHRAVRTS